MQGKKKRDKAAAEAAQEGAATEVEDQAPEDEGSTNFLGTKDEDVIF